MTTLSDTAYVPSPAMEVLVSVQFAAVNGAATFVAHNFNVDAVNVAEPEVVSLASGEIERISSFAPATWSARAVGGGSVVNESVLLAFAPRASAIT